MSPQKWSFRLGLFALVVWLTPVASLASPQSGQSSQTSPAPQTSDLEDILRDFKSYSIKSDTIYLHRETLLKELEKRGEFSAWGLTASEDSKAADVVITITLPFLTWEWNYKMVYQPTGTELGNGKVSAAVEKTAAPQLAAMIVKRIREARPLPASFEEAQVVPQAPNSSPGKGRSWRVRYISGSVPGLQKDEPITLRVNREWITFSASKNHSLSVPARNVKTTDSRTEIRKATKGWEDFWDRNCCGGDNDAGLILFVAPIFLAGYGILAPIKTTDHFVSMYWLEDGTVKNAEFRVSGDNAKSLLAELNRVGEGSTEPSPDAGDTKSHAAVRNKASRKSVVDIQELAKTTQNVITEQYDRSPVVETDRQVSIGWHVLEPGQYRLIVVARERDLAEVYFLPANKPAPDFSSGSLKEEDVGTQAVAELERRKKPLDGKAAPTISYREQNGIVTFNQIETSEFILQFTPIPLGFAK